MYINHMLKIQVAEPWNFRSYDGEHLFYCTVIDVNNTEEKELYLAQINSYFEINNKRADYVVLQKRGCMNNNQYNVFVFKEKYNNDFFGYDRDIGIKIDNKMIGSIKDILR